MLNMIQVMRLRRAGFVDYEIAQLNWAVAIDGTPQAINLKAQAWEATLSTRRKWIDSLRAQKWTDQQIFDNIMHFYTSDKGRTPWDFLKAEYKPPVRTDYAKARRERARRQTKQLYKKWR